MQRLPHRLVSYLLYYYNERWEKKWKRWLVAARSNANLHKQAKMLKKSYQKTLKSDLALWEAGNVGVKIYQKYLERVDELWNAAEPTLNMFWDMADPNRLASLGSTSGYSDIGGNRPSSH